MFKKNKLSILEWFILLVLLTIPVVNVIFVIWGVINNKFSLNLKNFGIAYIIWYVLVGGSIFTQLF